MVNLVQVPWQPTLYLTPDTLALLNAASDRIGAKLRLVGQDAAWRSYERQFYLYDLYKHHGGNTASSPDAPGQRMHMRGGAFDLISTSAPVQAACRAVGLVRDGVEPWHWNNPRLTSMPIIPTLTTPAGGNTTPIGNEEVVTATEVEAIAQRTARVILREFWIGDNPPMNRPMDITLYDILTDGEATRAAVESIAPRVGGLNQATIDAIANAVAAKIPSGGGAGAAGPNAAEIKAIVVDALKSVTYKAS